jgi:uncharacterized membrane protein YhhN
LNKEGILILSGLTFLAVFSAFLTIRARTNGPAVRVYIFKPLTTILILLTAFLADASLASSYQRLILFGLLFSLAGDVFLMLPKDRFIFGLFSFLIAHVFYIVAFTGGPGPGFTGWIIAMIVLIGVVQAALLLPYAGRMKLPVLAYMIVILVMLWRAWERFQVFGRTGTLLAAVGAALFVFSDSLLAWNRFRHPFRSAEAIKLSAYFAAQWLIACSVRP